MHCQGQGHEAHSTPDTQYGATGSHRKQYMEGHWLGRGEETRREGLKLQDSQGTDTR